MSPHYLPAADLRLCARWIGEAATPGRIAVAVSDPMRPRRTHGRIVLLDPTDATRHTLLEVAP